MTTLTDLLKKTALVLASGLFLPAASTTAFAQTETQAIVNTATAQWDVGNNKLLVNSNSVQFAVEQRPNQANITLPIVARCGVHHAVTSRHHMLWYRRANPYDVGRRIC